MGWPVMPMEERGTGEILTMCSFSWYIYPKWRVRERASNYSVLSLVAAVAFAVVTTVVVVDITIIVAVNC